MTLHDDIQLALRTWYPKDHKLHYDLDHPTMKLAGEAGELLDLYAKHKYKPDFDWWQCKWCKFTDWHHDNGKCISVDNYYTPLVIDELGDYLYYWRILAYLTKIRDYPENEGKIMDVGYLLSELLYSSTLIHKAYLDCIHKAHPDCVLEYALKGNYVVFNNILLSINITIAQIVQSNYQKLNSEATNHGWRGA